MRVEEIPAHESDFDTNHQDSNVKNFTYTTNSIPIAGESASMEYVNLKPSSGDNSYYFKIYNLFFSGYWAYHLGPGAIRG